MHAVSLPFYYLLIASSAPHIVVVLERLKPFYYLLIASRRQAPLRGAAPLVPTFYYLLIASHGAAQRVEHGVVAKTFYYLLIASVVCSSWGLLYGFPLFVPPLSLDVEHALSVSV